MSVYNPVTGELAKTVIGGQRIEANIDEKINLPSLTLILSKNEKQRLFDRTKIYGDYSRSRRRPSGQDQLDNNWPVNQGLCCQATVWL